jgi:hypothetical protein
MGGCKVAYRFVTDHKSVGMKPYIRINRLPDKIKDQTPLQFSSLRCRICRQLYFLRAIDRKMHARRLVNRALPLAVMSVHTTRRNKCTLDSFKPTPDQSDQSIRFSHAQLGNGTAGQVFENNKDRYTSHQKHSLGYNQSRTRDTSF